MVQARIPLPRQIARTPVVRQPSAFSALGDALSVAGQAGSEFVARDRATKEQVTEIDHRIAMAAQDREDRDLTVRKGAEWIALQAEVSSAVEAARQEADRYGDGHSDTVRKLLDEKLRAFDTSMVGNERVRQQFRQSIVREAAQIELREQAWQRQRNQEAQGEDFEVSVGTLANRLTRTDPANAGEEFAKAMADVDTMIGAGAFDDAAAATMKRKAATKLALGMNDGLFAAGQPQMVRALIDQGFYDSLELDTSKLGDQVAGEQRALDIAAEQEAEAKRIEARNAIDAIEAKIAIGINPTQAEFDAARAAGQAAGLPADELIAFDGLNVQIGLNRQFSEANDPSGAAAAQVVRQLAPKVASGTASEQEQVAYAHLQGVAETRAKAAGARYREMAGQGVQGQQAVLGELARLPRDQRFIAAQEAKDGLGYVAMLPAPAQRAALDGAEVRKARPKDFGEKDEVTKAFRSATGDFAGTLGGSYDDLMTLAWDIYAGQANAKGKEGFTREGFAVAIDIAFGGHRSSDGEWRGGVGTFGKHRVILPEWQTSDDFERSVRGLTFDKARYADGSAARKADVIDHYRPEYARDTADGDPVYRMIDATGAPLMSKSGKPYEFHVPRGKRR
tara:strand:- start:256 stop:2118 length:1863 start_codon:yes stop_codon:yes gene_type:complete